MSQTIDKDVKIVNKFGLHARPAMKLVETANKYSCDIQVAKGDLKVDAKSIMSVMRLAATKDSIVSISATGDDAKEAVNALSELIESGFGEL